MNWVDYIVLAVFAVSALSAFLRGLVREVMSIAAWAGAGLVAIWGAPGLEPNVRAWTGSADFSTPLTYAFVFVATLILLSVGAAMIGGLVRGIGLGAVDRTLGIVFGLVRAAALVIAAYIGAGYLVPPARWPEPVRQARALPFASDGATWLAARIPAPYRPSVAPLPPDRETRAVDLLRVPPQGRANDRP